MTKIFFLITFLLVHLYGRENPFFPSEGEIDLPYTSNEKIEMKPLKRVSVELPSTARIVKQITIEYENLDASISKKSIELDNSIDWHLPLFISQSYAPETTAKMKSKKVVNIIKKDLTFKAAGKIKYANFSLKNKQFKITTKDKLMRNFLLAQPHRIVMDFQRESSMKSYFKTINDAVFTKVRVGNHKGYYRVVVELDGYYRYKLKDMSDGCLIELK